ncbi:hypothetical protein ACFYMO_28205 [Streptomyces sp. NPDC007025]|uniref:hypothetical protein n=1 Tax=Streptomyces sp. NPDC007025 TaxID=3364771 RepID=UPI00368DE721
MGWESDEFGGDHEGHCVAVLGDGSKPAPVQVPFTRPDGTEGTSPNSSWWMYDGEHGPRAVAVRAGCTCGWRSTDMFPIDFDDWGKTDGFEDNTGPYAAWEIQHLARLLGATVPDRVREATDHLREMLTDLARTRPLAAAAAAAAAEKMSGKRLQLAVTAARDIEHTWPEIGDAMGVTRQSAHQRFAKNPYREDTTIPLRPRRIWADQDTPLVDLPPVPPGWADADDVPLITFDGPGEETSGK